MMMEAVFTEAADSGHNGHEFFGLDIECPGSVAALYIVRKAVSVSFRMVVSLSVRLNWFGEGLHALCQ